MPPKSVIENTLFYGDNLPILREYVPDESVDLIYLDPPFNSNRSYNVLFRDESGQEAEAQITAFDDSWHWGPSTERLYKELVEGGAERVARVMGALRGLVGPNQIGAYLVMMTARLVELHRVLKPSGSLYLHCDPTASHYLKIVLDAIFGPDRFRNEIIWKRSHAHNSANRYGPIHDTLLFYSRTDAYVWNDTRQPYTQEYQDRFFKFDDSDGRGPYWTGDITGAGVRHGETGNIWRGFNPTSKGRHWMYPPSMLDHLDADDRIFWPKTPGAWPKLKRYLADAKGIPLQDIWDDVYGLSTMGADRHERLGYPTQKPLALLERIVESSSNPGDLVLDPFCGCGTAIVAAEKLGRRWIGIDITHLAIALNKYRLRDTFPGVEFRVVGEPQDVAGARQLAVEDRYQFQWWALSLAQAKPVGGDGGKRGKKGSDTGVDGVINFLDNDKGKPRRVLVQVKSGHVKSGDVRDLRGVVEREGAKMGVFITLEPATEGIAKEAALAGVYTSMGWNRDYPRLQIFHDPSSSLAGSKVEMPGRQVTFKAAERATQYAANQRALGLG